MLTYVLDLLTSPARSHMPMGAAAEEAQVRFSVRGIRPADKEAVELLGLEIVGVVTPDDVGVVVVRSRLCHRFPSAFRLLHLVSPLRLARLS